MNQILAVEMSTDERKGKNGRNEKRPKQKKAEIKSVLVFFCIILLIFGIALIGMGLYSYLNTETEIDETTETVVEKPVIEVVQGTSTLDILIKSDYEIDNVVYSWNGDDETQINGNGEYEIELDNLNIPDGTNTLIITAKDVNGGEETYLSQYTKIEDEYTPTITLEQKTNTINVIIESEITLDYVSYTFDDETEIEEEIDDIEIEIPIEVTSGEHVLSITVANIDGEVYEDTKSFSIPSISVITDGENFIITANATTNITTIEVTLNGEEQEDIIVDDTQYELTLPLEEGENKLKIVVNTENGSYTRGVKYEK